MKAHAFKCSDRLWRRLVLAARERDRSASSMMRIALRRYLARVDRLAAKK